MPRCLATAINAVGVLNFMHDRLYSGRPFRTWSVIRFMEQLVETHGKPATIRCDNGAELTNHAFTQWCRDQHIEIRFIQPGEPDQNAFIERFNRTYREEVLTPYLFDSIEDARAITDEWLERYNQIRPHDALGSLPPARYCEQLLAA